MIKVVNIMRDEKIFNLANVYVLNNNVIKYKWETPSIKDIRSILSMSDINHPFDLTKCVARGYHVSKLKFTEQDVKNHILELMYTGNNIVFQYGLHIDVYTNSHYEEVFEANKLDDMTIIVRDIEED